MSTVAILIPAYNPPDGLYDILRGLTTALADCEFVLVDDGSTRPFDADLLASIGVHSLRQAVNRGKGAALKTGFEYIARELPGVTSIVTVDADGQHHGEDIARVSQAAKDIPDALVLGVRAFDGRVPMRSAFGNAIVRKIVAWFARVNIQDTQTGLRAYPITFAADCCAISSNRYEFEMEVILRAVRRKRAIQQVPISTLYEDGNESSHFRPLVDSARVVAAIFRSLSASFAPLAAGLIALELLRSVPVDIA